MIKDFKPICIQFVKETKTGLRYEVQDYNIDLELTKLDRKIAVDFLYFCNGKENISDIAKELKVKVSKLEPLIDILIKHNIILDSRKLFKFYQETGSIPGPYTPDLSRGHRKIIENTHKFGGFKEEILSLRKILNILEGLINNKNSLLEFFVVLNYNYGKFKNGLYKISPGKNRLVYLSKEHTKKLNRFLFTTDITDNSSAIIFIVANHKFSNDINANRRYRYSFLESGSIAQNISQLAKGQDVGITQCAEFNDKAISRFLDLEENQFCTTTLILGKKYKESEVVGKNSSQVSIQSKVDDLKSFLTKIKFLRTIQVKTYQEGDYFMQKYSTMAMSFENARNSRTYTTCGVAETILESKLKCLVEMYERYASSLLRVDKEIIFNNQENFFSITKNSPLNRKYLFKKKLQQVGIGKKVKCVNAIGLLDNKKYLVPVDEVFYPIKNAIYYKTNSSGVAAHYKKDLAINNALYELIERDAVLVSWYSKKKPNMLDNAYLSEDLKQRVLNLEKKKVKVDFLDMTLDSCAVILCLIHNDKYPKTSVGCSANVEIDKAIEKSLDEAELMLNTWNEEGKKNRIVEKHEVENVIDHGNIFARVILKNSEYKWIVSGEKIKKVKPTIFDFNELIKKFEPKVIDINKKKDLGLYVVRVMSNKLLPLTFGFGSEHYGHPRLKELQLNWGSDYPLLPHFIP